MTGAAVDIPVTDLDVFGRYVLGIRRFTDSHLAAVDRYITDSWGQHLDALATTRFLDRFSVFEQRGSACRFSRHVPARRRPPGPVTWRITSAGVAALGDTPAPTDIARWSNLPGRGWESLLALWAASARTATQRDLHQRRLEAFQATEPAATTTSLRVGKPLSSNQIAAVVATLNPALSRLADVDPSTRLATLLGQLRWLHDRGLIARSPRRPRSVLTERFHYIDQWGWQWLRRAARHRGLAMSSLPLFTELLHRAARSPAWSPRQLTQANNTVLVAYQRTQRLVDQLLIRHPRRWRGCAQEFAVTDIEFLDTGDTRGVELPVPADSTAIAGSHRSWRRFDAVLWQAGDPWSHPSVLIEYEAGRSNIRVRHHLVAALHVAAVTRRPTIVVFVATRQAQRNVRRAVHDELHVRRIAALPGHWPGVRLRVRLTSWAAASRGDPLTCPAVIEESITVPAGPRRGPAT